MSKKEKNYYNFFGPKERKDQDDAVSAFLEQGGRVTKLKETSGTSDHAWHRLEKDGIDDNEGRTGGVALFGRVERSTVPSPKEKE